SAITSLLGGRGQPPGTSFAAGVRWALHFRRTLMADLAVLNAGGWGTAVACVLADRGHRVALWARRPEAAAALREKRENADYSPGVTLPVGVEPTADLEAAVADRAALLVTSTSRGLRGLARDLEPLLLRDIPLLVGTKGLEWETWLRPSQVMLEEIG